MMHVSRADMAELEAAVNAVDHMILQADTDNAQERIDHRLDRRRLDRYEARRAALIAHRAQLQALFVKITGHDPWRDVAF